MINKIKNNFNKIMLFLSLIAIGLVVPDLFNLFSSELNNSSIVSLISIGALIAVNIIMACTYKKEITSKIILIPLIIYVVSKVISYVNGIIQNQFVSIAYLALYIAIMVLYIIQLNNKNKNLLYSLYVLLALAISFTLLSTFAGSRTGFSNLLTLTLFTFIIYFDKESLKNEENNNISLNN